MKRIKPNRKSNSNQSKGITELYECASKIGPPSPEEQPEPTAALWLADPVSRQFPFDRELIPDWDSLPSLLKEFRTLAIWSYFTKDEVQMLRTYLEKHGYTYVTVRPIAISDITEVPRPDYDSIIELSDEYKETLPFEVVGLIFEQSTIDEIRKKETARKRQVAEGVREPRGESHQLAKEESPGLRHMMRIADGLETLPHHGRK